MKKSSIVTMMAVLLSLGFCVLYFGLFARINAGGQTILMVTHSVKAASKAGRVLFIRDGEGFHQVYRGQMTDEQLYQKISDTLTMLATGGDRR